MIKYLSAFLISALFSAIFTFAIIPVLRRLKAGQSILSYVKEHEYKGGTPTMGGAVFIAVAAAVTLAYSSRENFRTAAVVCAAGASFALVGFLDDFIKIRLSRNEGLKPYQKIFFQLAVASIISVYAFFRGYAAVVLPFSGRTVNLGAWFIPFAVFVFIATTNCVNLTDGLDGLAAGTSYVYLLAIAAVVVARSGAGNDFALASLALAGALVGFLAFNTYRAKVFMGDTGSLGLGGFIAAVSLLSGNALLIPIVGVMFVLSGISVIAQVVYYKRTKKRIFLMAPLHHHLQMKGASESKIAFAYKFVTMFFGIICVIFALARG